MPASGMSYFQRGWGIIGAAESYVRAKFGRRETERMCHEAGVVFQLMIFESLGGFSVEADRVIKCLNKPVASTTDSPRGKSQLCFGTVLEWICRE